jgi:hypothetical protein
VLGDTLSDTDNETDLSLNGLLDTLGSDRGRDEDGGSGSASLLDSIGDGCEDGLAQVCLAGLLGVGTTDDLGAVLNGLLGVEGTLLAGEALEDDLGLVVDAEVGVGGQVGRRGAAVGARSGAQGGAQGLSEALHFGSWVVVVLVVVWREQYNFLDELCFRKAVAILERPMPTAALAGSIRSCRAFAYSRLVVCGGLTSFRTFCPRHDIHCN